MLDTAVPGLRSTRGSACAAGRLLVIACLFAAFAAPAHATAPVWLPAQRIEPAEATLNAVSCASPTMCVAAAGVPVIQDNGPSFEPATDPDPGATLNAVSCAPSSDFCMFADRKSTRLNSSHMSISYAVFCLKKKKKNT